MPTSKDLKRYRQTIEEAVVGIGRDDVGVGDVREAREGMLSVTFARGTHTSAAEISIDRLHDREQAKQAVNIALLTLSKGVSQEAIEKTEADLRAAYGARDVVDTERRGRPAGAGPAA